MKTTPLLLCSALAFSLTACGGGGGGDSAPSVEAPSTQTTAQLAEYDGVWTLEPANNPCMDEFPFASAPTYYRLRDMTLTSSQGETTAALAFEIFSDATCATKLGQAIESFDWHPTAVQRAGRDNVIAATPSWKGVSLSGNGDKRVTLNGLPSAKNNITGWEGLKLIADVQGNKLFHMSSDAGVALDSQGYPVEFNSQLFFVKK